MAKEVVINTSGLNCYGSRVLTAGIDLTQYQRNPILLFMHKRSTSGTLPIGRMENLRIDGDRLIGTPVFDENDPFAKQIADKWEKGFLRMASAGIEILATSVDPADIVEGQTRATVTRSKLEEVSIVDIGGNDDALQLSHGGNVLTLAAGEASELLPLVELAAPETGKETDNADPSANSNQLNKKQMNKETLQLLGLGENATEQEIHEKVKLLKELADKSERLQLSAIEQAVDAAVAEKRITADKRDHFISLGKSAGIESLRETLQLMQPARKPADVIEQHDAPAGGQHQTFAKLSEVPDDQLEKLRTENRKEYARLYKAEYGVELPEIEK